MADVIPNLRGLSLETTLCEREECVVYGGYLSDNATAVVVKVIDDWNPESSRARAVQRAFSISAGTRLAPIVRSLRAFDSGYQHVVVMADTGATPLRDVLRGRQQDSESTLQLGIAICEALDQLHHHQIFHGLPSPDHVLVHPRTREVWLVGFDYGVAPAAGELACPEVASWDVPYAAPELAGQISQSVDQRTDLYTLGITLYEALVGSHPFAALDPLQAAHAHVVPSAGTLAKQRPDIPSVLCEIVDKLLAANPWARYQSTFGLKADLQRCLDEVRRTDGCESFALGIDDVLTALTTPNKLYGRDSELALLESNYERCVAGDCCLVAIAGPPGIGKTRLVAAARQSMERQGALFVGGKVEQFSRGKPFAPLADALSELIEHLLGQDEESFQQNRSELRDAIGIHAPALVDLLPELTHIVGEQKPESAVGPEQAQNRIQLALPGLIKALASPRRPLVVFLDDLQWADAATVAAIELLLSEPDMSALQIIVSYRDTEVDNAHPLIELLGRIPNTSVAFAHLTLSAISQQGLCQWVGDGLNYSAEQVAPLAALLEEHSGGNPFVVVQLLFTLRHRGLLYLDESSRRWSWKSRKISELGYADDAAALLAGRIGELQEQTQHVLAVAACAGRTFEARLIADVTGIRKPQLSRLLADAERKGVVSVQAHDEWHSFRHDRLQEAAKVYLSVEREHQIRWKLGQALLKRGAHIESPQEIFSIVEQLNPARALMATEQHRHELAQLNLLAGQVAQRTTAFDEALQYYEIAAEQLGEDAWETNYPQMFEAKYRIAECMYVLGQFAAVEPKYTELSHHATIALDKARVSSALANFYGNQGMYGRAVEIGLQGLSFLGWDVPTDPELIASQTQQLAVRVNAILDEIDYCFDPHRSALTDPEMLLGFGISLPLMPLAFVGERVDLYGVMAARGAELALTNGPCQFSALALARYTPVLAGGLGQYQRAFKVGQMSLSLCRHFSNAPHNGSTIHNLTTFTTHWGQSARDAHMLFEEALRECLRYGDFVGVAHCIITDAYAHWAANGTLGACVQDLDYYLSLRDRAKTGVMSKLLVAIRSGVGWLNSDCSVVDQEARALTAEIENGVEMNATIHAYHDVLHLMLHCVLGNYEKAAEVAERGAKYMSAFGGIYIWSQFFFFRPFVLAQQLPHMSDEGAKLALKTISADLDLLDRWAQVCPVNYAHEAALVRGAMHAAEGNELKALRCIDQAIDGARAGGFVMHEALAQELAGKVCIENGLRRVAVDYLSLAHRCFQSWGASVKARQLAQQYGDLLAEQLGWYSNRSTAGVAEGKSELEYLAVLKAAQSIARETDPHQLIRSLMETLLECSGATRALLLKREHGQWTVRAEIRDRGDGARLHGADTTRADASSEVVPMGVVHHAHRADGPVVVDEARMNFVVEPAYRSKFSPLSVMCLPIRGGGETSQLVYLESSSAQNVFNKDRCAALNVVVGQAAISLSNAELYDELKREIVEKAKAQRELEGLLSEKDALLCEVHHGVRNNLQVIKSMLSLQARTAGHSGDALHRAGGRVDALSVVHDLLHANDDLTDVDLLTLADRLCSRLRASYGGCTNISIVVRGTLGKSVGAAATVPCSLIINEAVTNALQHAFPNGRDGKIVVSVDGEGETRTIEVRDDGVGLPAGWDRHKSKSLGALLLDGMTQQLDGELDLQNDHGTVVALRFPARG